MGVISADVVYVGAVQTKHLEVASLMLRSGKPVLCEKPLCMNVRETQKLLDVARENKVFLMEVRQNIPLSLSSNNAL